MAKTMRLMFLSLLGAAVVFAQGLASLNGTVSDPTGAVSTPAEAVMLFVDFSWPAKVYDPAAGAVAPLLAPHAAPVNEAPDLAP